MSAVDFKLPAEVSLVLLAEVKHFHDSGCSLDIPNWVGPCETCALIEHTEDVIATGYLQSVILHDMVARLNGHTKGLDVRSSDNSFSPLREGLGVMIPAPRILPEDRL